MNMTKRFLFSFLIALWFSNYALSQNKISSDDENNPYSKALFASLHKMDTSWGKISTTDCGNRVCLNYKNVIVEYDYKITQKLPFQSGEYKVEYLNTQELIDRYKKLKKEFAVFRIHPMEINENRLVIRVTVHWFRYKEPHLIYAISDWGNVYFHYDCEKQEFVIEEVKLGGI